MHPNNQPFPPSVLARLRALIPARDGISLTEALRIAELQANTLLELRAVANGPVPTEIISELPKIVIENTGRLVSGASFWSRRHQVWIIQLSRADSASRRRFTLAHEYKHIIDHGRQTALYRGTRIKSAAAQAEQAADYFAGCLLIPRRFLKRAWGDGIQDAGELADLFQVSEQAIGVRLRQTGLVDSWSRHQPRHLPFGSDRHLVGDGDDEMPEPIGEGGVPA